MEMADAVLETLRGRGWSFGDLDEVRAVIMINTALADDPSSVLDSVESELTNMDLRSIGAKSLPEPSLLRKSSRILGPLVLQISSVRDIMRGSLDGISKASNGRRLLRFGLTDGHTEITAIEYSHIPSIPDDIVPGTKVRLENKAPVHSGIVCLSSKELTVLGGVVQSLYEEWKMNQKYSGLSRASLKLSRGGDADGPPPFEKLQVGAPSHKFSQKGKSSYQKEVFSKSNRPPAVDSGNSASKSTELQQNVDKKAINSINSDSQTEKLEEKPSTSETRPREVVEAIPVQNQAASQKLLQKMSQQNEGNRHFNRRHRGKGKVEDPVVYTLEEYERRKSGAKQLKDEFPITNHDEELARRLQNQFDLEDSQSHVRENPSTTNAEHIRMNMFNYERDTSTGHGGRGRGGGRGRRGRGRGRGRGRFH